MDIKGIYVFAVKNPSVLVLYNKDLSTLIFRPLKDFIIPISNIVYINAGFP